MARASERRRQGGRAGGRKRKKERERDRQTQCLGLGVLRGI